MKKEKNYMKDRIDAVVKAIDTLVDEIYTLEQKELNEKFIDVLDAMDQFIIWMEDKGYIVNMQKELELMQNAYAKKDYAMLADCMLYDIKPQFEELK